MKNLVPDLSESSSIQDLLRTLFRLNLDVVRARSDGKVRLFHKEQLFALVERGLGGRTLASLPSVPGMTQAALDHLAPQTIILDLLGRQVSTRPLNEGEDRPFVDPWFDVPLPIVCIQEDSLVFNEEALSRWGELKLPLDSLQQMALGEEKPLQSEEGRHFMVRHLGRGRYFLDDVSIDVLAAQEIVWWAAVGKALVSRMEENGASIERFSPDSREVSRDRSLIPCLWEGELLGHLAVRPLEEEPDP